MLRRFRRAFPRGKERGEEKERNDDRQEEKDSAVSCWMRVVSTNVRFESRRIRRNRERERERNRNLRGKMIRNNGGRIGHARLVLNY